jgi:hypothetical protein
MSYRLLEDEVKDATTRIALARELKKYFGEVYQKETEVKISGIYTRLFISFLKSGKPLKHTNLFFKTMFCMSYQEFFEVIKQKAIGSN